MPQTNKTARYRRLAATQLRLNKRFRDEAESTSAGSSREPRMLGDMLSAFMVERGLNRLVSSDLIERTVARVLGPQKATMIRVGQMRRGVLHIGVANSCLLEELRSFQKPALLRSLRESGAAQGLCDIRFRLTRIDTNAS